MRSHPRLSTTNARTNTAFTSHTSQRAASCDDLDRILTLADRESAKSGIGAMDSLHIAAAHLLNADEFVTTEKPVKSIYRTRLVKVVYLFQ